MERLFVLSGLSNVLVNVVALEGCILPKQLLLYLYEHLTVFQCHFLLTMRFPVMNLRNQCAHIPVTNSKLMKQRGN